MENSISVRPMTPDEMPLWGTLRTKLWPNCLEAENQADFDTFTAGEGGLKIVFLAFAKDTAVGFAEIGERSIAAGCGNDPAAYLEGWYVEPDFRGQRVGKALISAAAEWASDKGYNYFASDVELDNLTSQKAHQAMGFDETGRVVTYARRLT